MSILEAFAVFLAGAGAGFINAIVGAGTLITFSTLLAFGVPPVVANASNNVGLAPGSLSAAWGYRRELSGQRHRVWLLASASLLGAIIGAVLLLALPSEAFNAIVPALILLGVVLVIAQKPLSRWVSRHHPQGDESGNPVGTPGWVWIGVFLCGIYGGYFGAAQGVLLMANMGIAISESMQRLNAVKNVLATVANTVAGVIFVVLAPVDWRIAGLIAVGSVIGAQIGAQFGRRLPEVVYRTFIVVVGLTALVVFLLR